MIEDINARLQAAICYSTHIELRVVLIGAADQAMNWLISANVPLGTMSKAYGERCWLGKRMTSGGADGKVWATALIFLSAWGSSS